jgi:hypothetical protein
LISFEQLYNIAKQERQKLAPDWQECLFNPAVMADFELRVRRINLRSRERRRMESHNFLPDFNQCLDTVKKEMTDQGWLIKELGRLPTLDELECFCERVAIKVECANIPENQARIEALNCLKLS